MGCRVTMETVAAPGELNQDLGTCSSVVNCGFTIPFQQSSIITVDLWLLCVYYSAPSASEFLRESCYFFSTPDVGVFGEEEELVFLVHSMQDHMKPPHI